ncbi:MAG TPA: hypothetical protein VIL99_02685 [Ignavibacteria bacterium]
MKELNYPDILKVEDTFNEFVLSVGGRLVKDLIADNSNPDLNADYFFENQEFIIAELKCLQKDGLSEDKGNNRLLEITKNVFEGKSTNKREIFLWTLGLIPMPKEIFNGIRKIVRRAFETHVKKAQKQIRATKIMLNSPNAKGIILLCNDGYYSLDPSLMFGFLCELMQDNFKKSNEIDAVVYFTVNIPSKDDTDKYELMVWIPAYKTDNSPLGNFVNNLGKKWWKFYKKKIGEENLDTPHYTGQNALDKLKQLKTIKKKKVKK